ncbi:hypothetical protein [Azohydromonas aeria]|uniref:hypothetical protein n=1 Tax=Azohydromonas aeria TaxID=2590212 RepID=UPI0012F9DEAF|nr:hypothetical protein [Azohydromonas aeria]
MTQATDILYRGRWWATAVLLLCLVRVVFWALDREPPFELRGASVEQPVEPGGPVRITLDVRRDLSRNCSLLIVRYLIDGARFRFYLPTIELDASALEQLERQTPGENRILLQMPPEATAGKGAFGNVLSYACNPVHFVWPLRVAYEVPFEIAPAETQP